MSGLGTYRLYLKGYVEGLAKLAVPTTPSDEGEACAYVLGWRHAVSEADIAGRSEVERLVAALGK